MWNVKSVIVWNVSFCLTSCSFKFTGPNNLDFQSIETSVLEVIKSQKLQYLDCSYKHEAFQNLKHKLDLIEQPYLDKRHSLRTNINTLGNLVFRWRNYDPRQSLSLETFLLSVCLLLHLLPSSLFLIYKHLVCKEVFPVVTWNNCNLFSKL